MAQEIVITSVPRGVRPGRTGFQIAMRTAGMRDDVCTQLESLGGYRHMPSGGGPNPVCYFYKIVQTGLGPLSVLGRVVDAGADYSSRSNKLAHLVVLSPSEVATLSASSPAAVLRVIEPRLVSRWTGAPEERTQPFGLGGMPTASSRVCAEWQRVKGDAGWAGVVAERIIGNQPVLVVAPSSAPEWCERILRLFDEATCMLPAVRRWSIGFETTILGSVGVPLRGTYAGSPESRSRQPGLLSIDLAALEPLPAEYLGSELVTQARGNVSPRQRTAIRLPPTAPKPPPVESVKDEFGFPMAASARSTPGPPPVTTSLKPVAGPTAEDVRPRRERVRRSGGSREGGQHVYEDDNHWQAKIAWGVVLAMIVIIGVVTTTLFTSRPNQLHQARQGDVTDPNPQTEPQGPKAVSEPGPQEGKQANGPVLPAAPPPSANESDNRGAPETTAADSQKQATNAAPNLSGQPSQKAESKPLQTNQPAPATKPDSASQPAASRGADRPPPESANGSAAMSIDADMEKYAVVITATSNDPDKNKKAEDSLKKNAKEMIAWRKKDQFVKVVSDLTEPEHLRLEVLLPKNSLAWILSVKQEDDRKKSWTLKGIPGNADCEWGQLVLMKEPSSTTGDLCFKRLSDCPEICKFVPIRLRLSSTTMLDLGFNADLRSATLVDGGVRGTDPEQESKASESLPGLKDLGCVVLERSKKSDDWRIVETGGQKNLLFTTSERSGCISMHELTYEPKEAVSLSKVDLLKQMSESRHSFNSKTIGQLLKEPSMDLMRQFVEEVLVRTGFDPKTSFYPPQQGNDGKGEMRRKMNNWNKGMHSDSIRDKIYEHVKEWDKTFVLVPTVSEEPVPSANEKNGTGGNAENGKVKGAHFDFKEPHGTFAEWIDVFRERTKKLCKDKGFEVVDGPSDARTLLSKESDWVESTKADGSPRGDKVLLYLLTFMAEADVTRRRLEVCRGQASADEALSAKDSAQVQLVFEWPDDDPIKKLPITVLKLEPASK